MSQIKILLEDKDWLIVDKPAGMLSQRGKRLLPNVLDQLREKDRFLSCVHRLDTNVTGVLVLAKRPDAARHFHRELRLHQVRKQYLALLESQEASFLPQSWINLGIKRDQRLMLFPYTEKMFPPAHVCRLEIGTREKWGMGLHLVEIVLLTGVFHQIRAQCAHRGMPVLGDVKYGGHALPMHRLALHASTVVFPDLRRQGQFVTVTASVPSWFQEVKASSGSRDFF